MTVQIGEAVSKRSEVTSACSKPCRSSFITPVYEGGILQRQTSATILRHGSLAFRVAFFTPASHVCRPN